MPLRKTAPYVRWLSFFILFSLLAASTLQAQRARIAWLADSLDLGRPTPLALVVTYSTGYQIALPDSATGYGAFELVDVWRAPRTEVSGLVRDSFRLRLRSFSIDSLQGLGLELSLQSPTDTIRLAADSAFVRFAPRVTNYSENLPYLPDLRVLSVQRPFNFLAFALWAVGIIGLLGVGYYFIRRPVWAYLQRRRLRKQWAALLTEIEELRARADENHEAYIQHLNRLWKTYLSPYLQKNLLAYSSRELGRLLDATDRLLPEERAALVHLAKAEEQIHYAHIDFKLSEALSEVDRLRGALEKAFAFRLAQYPIRFYR